MPAAGDDGVNDHHQHQHHHLSFSRSLGAVFSSSLQILISNRKMFSYIFLLIALPLSLLLSSLSLSSAILTRRILHLRSLAAIVSIRIEALNILDDARQDAQSLFRLRAFHALITLPLSILLLLLIASASFLVRRRRTPTLRSTWWRSLLTGLMAYAATEALRIPSTVLGPIAGLAISIATVFLKSVLDMAMVVTVVEDKVYGFDALVMAWELMSGRRMAGWALAAVAELATVLIWWGMVGVEEIDVYGSDRNAGGIGILIWRGGVAFLYAALLILCNVALMAFNSECTAAAGFKNVDDDCL